MAMMYAVFKEHKVNSDDLWIDAEVEPVDLLPSKQDALEVKHRLESMNNQNQITRFIIQPQVI